MTPTVLCRVAARSRIWRCESGALAPASALRTRHSGVSGCGARSAGGGWRSRKEGLLSVFLELDLDVVETACGAMLDGHEGLPVATAQVEVTVSPGVQLTAAPQGLARPRGPALASVVDEQHGGLEAALQVAQEAEDGGDVCDGVLVHAVQADQGVEDHEARCDALHGLLQTVPVVEMVEAQCRHVDDGDVEGLEAGACGPGDPLQTLAHEVAGVLGGEQQDRAGAGRGEVPQAWDAGGDCDREVQRQDGLAALWLAADDADGLLAP